MASPFTRAVVSSMRKLYPEVLADKTFDNTGLLLEAPFLPSQRNRNSVLLTIDLTKAVAEEAIQNNHSAVIAYHPIIFRPLKSITLDDSQQHSLLRLTAHGISVYCPHTAVDIVPGGMADWLCDIVTGKLDAPEPEAFTVPEYDLTSPASDTSVTTSESGSTSQSSPQTQDQQSSPTTPDQPISTDPFTSTPKPAASKPKPKPPSALHRTYSKPVYPHRTPTFHMAALPHTRTIITPSPSSSLATANANALPNDTPLYTPSTTGSGRLITFSTPQPLTLLITRIAHAIGLPKGFPVAIPQNAAMESLYIKTVGVCPGSGASVIHACHPPPDLVFTGELSHHDALAVTERGGCVVTLFHSNSERGFLHAVLVPLLQKTLTEEWERSRREMMKDDGGGGGGTGMENTSDGGGGGDRRGWQQDQDGIKEILRDETVEISVSQVDRDPFGIVVLVDSQVDGVRIESPEQS